MASDEGECGGGGGGDDGQQTSKRSEKKLKQMGQRMVKEDAKIRIKRVKQLLKKVESERTPEEKDFLSQSVDEVIELQKRTHRNTKIKDHKLEKEEDDEELEEKSRRLAEMFAAAKCAVVYTGAGISTAASIPDYRGPQGVWTMMNKGGRKSTNAGTEQALQLAIDISKAEPTFTHMAIAKLADLGIVKHVVSQNCDGLHLRSGVPQNKISEIHGNMNIEVCSGSCQGDKRVFIRNFDVTKRTSFRRHFTENRCTHCGSQLKDTIVHFGEKGPTDPVPPHHWPAAARFARKADLIVCIGSSLKILRKYSCLWNMERKKRERARIVIVNLQWTPKDNSSSLKINGKCDDVVRRVMKYLRVQVPPYIPAKDPVFGRFSTITAASTAAASTAATSTAATSTIAASTAATSTAATSTAATAASIASTAAMSPATAPFSATTPSAISTASTIAAAASTASATFLNVAGGAFHSPDAPPPRSDDKSDDRSDKSDSSEDDSVFDPPLEIALPPPPPPPLHSSLLLGGDCGEDEDEDAAVNRRSSCFDNDVLEGFCGADGYPAALATAADSLSSVIGNLGGGGGGGGTAVAVETIPAAGDVPMLLMVREDDDVDDIGARNSGARDDADDESDDDDDDEDDDGAIDGIGVGVNAGDDVNHFTITSPSSRSVPMTTAVAASAVAAAAAVVEKMTHESIFRPWADDSGGGAATTTAAGGGQVPSSLSSSTASPAVATQPGEEPREEPVFLTWAELVSARSVPLSVPRDGEDTTAAETAAVEEAEATAAAAAACNVQVETVGPKFFEWSQLSSSPSQAQQQQHQEQHQEQQHKTEDSPSSQSILDNLPTAASAASEPSCSDVSLNLEVEDEDELDVAFEAGVGAAAPGGVGAAGEVEGGVGQTLPQLPGWMQSLKPRKVHSTAKKRRKITPKS